MKLRQICFRVIIIVAALFARTSVVAAQQDFTARADSIVSSLLAADKPGCAIRVTDHGTPVYTRYAGLASIESQTPISATTRFDIGSVSKQFTALLVLMLEREGRLARNDPIRKYIPELPLWGNKVLVRHLLAQTSGVKDYIDLFPLAGIPYEAAVTPNDALAMLARQKSLNFEPGSEWAYSNSNYFLLSLIAERVSKQPMSKLLEERIFKPLGMSSSTLWTDHLQVVPGHADSYTAATGTFQHVAYNWNTTGDGAIQSTLDDMTRWLNNLDSATVGGREIISLMQTPPPLSNGSPTTYGYGLVISRPGGHPLVWHNGAAFGFRAEALRYTAAGIGIITLCNSDVVNPRVLDQRLAALFLEGRSPPPPPAGAVVAATPPAGDASAASESGEEYAGTYFSNGSGSLRYLRDSSGVLSYSQGGPPRAVRALGNGRFAVTGVPIELRFDKARAPRVLEERVGVAQPLLYERVDSAVALSTAALARYEGTFESRDLGVRWIVKSTGKSLTVRPDVRVAVTDTLTNDFRDGFSTPGSSIRFTRNAAGRVTGFSVWTRGVRAMKFVRVN